MTPRASTRLRTLAWLTMLSMLMVVALSAFMRHDAAGIGCVPWPGCYGQNPAAGAPAPHNAGIVAARIAHRVFASFVLLAAIAMLAMSARARPRLHREALLSGALLVLALGLAVLGIFTPGARQPVVAIGNLLGGFLMLALAVRLAIPRGGAGMGPPAIVAAVLLLCQDAGGALVSASLAGLSCEELVQCVQRSAQAGWPLQALSPWRAPASPGSADALAGALPQLLHRLFAIATAGATGFLAIKAIRVGRHDAGQLLLVLLAASLLLGLIAAGSALPMAIVLLHNLCAACLLAITIRLV